jgi:uncharacterized damage-inducible protein DinB
MTDRLQQLLAHMKWADARVLDSMRGGSGGSYGGDPRALEIYAHVLGAEHVWLTRLKQEPATVAVWPRLDVAACAALAQANASGLEEFIDGLTASDLDRIVAYRNSADVPFESSVADILLHVFMHGAYHRGQVALLVRDGGNEPTATDYIAFVRGAPAATRSVGK